jgi:hypothetical protein
MSCVEWQEKIALFTGADLPADEAPAVEAHLSECAECRTFKRELSETRAMLLSMRTIDEADVAVVRSKVVGELGTRCRRPLLAWLPYAAAVAVFIFGMTMWRAGSLSKPPLNHARGSLVSIPKEPSASANGGGLRPVARRKPQVKPRPKPATEPTVVTLFTDDPDVVIVWITD